MPAANSARLAALLRADGAAVTHQELPLGLGLSRMDSALTGQWLTTLSAG